MKAKHMHTIFALFSLILLSTNCQLLRTLMTKRQLEPLPPKLRNIRNLGATMGSLPIKETGSDLPYITTIRVGSNNAQLNLVIDTGSPIVWVPDSSLSSKFTHAFDCSKSKSCSPKEDKALNLVYGSGKIEGQIVNDQIKLGDLTLPKFDMLLVNNTNDIDTSYFDGMLGLSLGSYDADLPTVLDSLKSEGIIDKRIFSMYLGNSEVPGELTFGGYDSSYTEKDFKFVKIKSELDPIHWITQVTGVGLGKSEPISFSDNYPAIFDSGTQILVLPQNVVDKIVNQVTLKNLHVTFAEDDGIHWCKCTAREKLDDLIFHFEGSSFSVPASSYVKASAKGCYLALMAVEAAGIPVPIILGDVFLKNYYAVYNADEQTVGLAEVKSGSNEGEVSHPFLTIVLFVVIVVTMCYWMKKNHEKKTENPAFSQGKGVTIGGSGPVRGRVRRGDFQAVQELSQVGNDNTDQDISNSDL